MTSSLYDIPPFLKHRLNEYNVNGYVFRTMLVEKGSFVMWSSDKGAHEVTIANNFELGLVPVTQGLWRAVMGSDWPNFYFIGDERPVESVSWDSICTRGGFFDKLNAWLAQSSQSMYDAPFCLCTEAQWEYAARGGKYHIHAEQEYAGSSRLDEVGWHMENNGIETHIVGQKQPNILGLYDMSGNVWEWCQEWYGNFYFRVVRGGSWNGDPHFCRVASRSAYDPYLSHSLVGFRLARTF